MISELLSSVWNIRLNHAVPLSTRLLKVRAEPVSLDRGFVATLLDRVFR